MSTGNFAGDVAFVNANQYYLETPHDDKDGDKAAVFLDRDGDVTGMAGAYVVANHPFLVTARVHRRGRSGTPTSVPSAMSASACGATPRVVAPLTITRDDAAALTLVGVPDNPNSAHASLLPGRGYTVQFAGAVAAAAPDLAEPDRSKASGSGSPLPVPAGGPAGDPRLQRLSPLPAAADLAELEASTGDRYWYDSGHRDAAPEDGHAERADLGHDPGGAAVATVTLSEARGTRPAWSPSLRSG